MSLALLLALSTITPSSAAPDALIPWSEKAARVAHARQGDAVRKAACKGERCVAECPSEDAEELFANMIVFGHFSRSGGLEALVGLKSCLGTPGRPNATSLVLVRATRKGWEFVDARKDFNGTREQCRAPLVEGRQALVCLATWGPYPGGVYSYVLGGITVDANNKLVWSPGLRVESSDSPSSCRNGTVASTSITSFAVAGKQEDAALLDVTIETKQIRYRSAPAAKDEEELVESIQDPACADAAKKLELLDAKPRVLRLEFGTAGFRLNPVAEKALRNHPISELEVGEAPSE